MQNREMPEISTIRAHHQSQLELCDRLEKFADSLPWKYDTQECLSIAWALYPTIKAAHNFEEEVLFPILMPKEEDETNITKSLERLRYEHWEDESYAEEISLALRQLIHEPKLTNVDKLSYMLRGFFESLRRHIAFESEHILPILLTHQKV